MNTLQQKIESLLFYKNEPVSFSWLAKQLQSKDIDIKENLYNMLKYYNNRGIFLVISENKASLMSAEISSDLIKKISKEDDKKELSRQAIETISIILYKGEVTKSELDYIRGVNSVYILRNLLIRGLIEKNINRLDKRSNVYSVTHDAMSFLGINQIKDLPKFDYFKNKLKDLESDFVEENLNDSSSVLIETHNK